MLGQSQDNWVAVPISTYQQTYGFNDSVDIFARAGGTPESMERAKDEVQVLMRARRHDAVGEPTTSRSRPTTPSSTSGKQISAIFFDVVIGIASISLVVGGIVIMNIMLVSVTERTREIGVRKALGARQRDVLLQFLIESGTMALVGGFIGVMCGVIVAKLITLIIASPPACSCGACCWACSWPPPPASFSACTRQQSRKAGSGRRVAGGIVRNRWQVTK